MSTRPALGAVLLSAALLVMPAGSATAAPDRLPPEPSVPAATAPPNSRAVPAPTSTPPGVSPQPRATAVAALDWPVAVPAALLLLVAAGAGALVVRGRSSRRPAGRHRAPKPSWRRSSARPGSTASVATGPSGPSAPAPLPPAHAGELPPGLTAQDVADLAALDTETPFEVTELGASPLTGDTTRRRPRLPTSGGHPEEAAPAARTTGTHAASSATFVDDSTTSSPAPARSVPSGPSMSPLERVNRVAAAWQERDADELAALAAHDIDASLAGSVLAAVVASESGDPRAFGYLQAAFADGREPADQALLGPYLPQITFQVTVSDLGVDEALPCSRRALGCALACAERAVSDPESAYAVLLELDDDPLVRVLRAQSALDMAWPARALRAARGDDDGGRFAAVLRGLEGAALAESGHPAEAVAALTSALELQLEDTKLAGGEQLRQRLLFERALAYSASGDVGGAWEDLTLLLAENADYPEAADLLKHL